MGNTEKFDEMASNYDTVERTFIADISSTSIREVVNSESNVKHFRSGLDFGCGTGIVGLNLMDMFDKVYFVDTSLNMLEVVDAKLNKLGLDNSETLYLDLEKDDSLDINIKVDCIFMCQVLLHIKDYKPVLEKLKNLLNENGRLFIVDFDKNNNISSELVHNGFNQKDLCCAIKDMGFSKVESKNFYNGDKIFMNQDATMFVLSAEL